MRPGAPLIVALALVVAGCAMPPLALAFADDWSFQHSITTVPSCTYEVSFLLHTLHPQPPALAAAAHAAVGGTEEFGNDGGSGSGSDSDGGSGSSERVECCESESAAVLASVTDEATEEPLFTDIYAERMVYHHPTVHLFRFRAEGRASLLYLAPLPAITNDSDCGHSSGSGSDHGSGSGVGSSRVAVSRVTVEGVPSRGRSASACVAASLSLSLPLPPSLALRSNGYNPLSHIHPSNGMQALNQPLSAQGLTGWQHPGGWSQTGDEWMGERQLGRGRSSAVSMQWQHQWQWQQEMEEHDKEAGWGGLVEAGRVETPEGHVMRERKSDGFVEGGEEDESVGEVEGGRTEAHHGYEMMHRSSDRRLQDGQPSQQHVAVAVADRVAVAAPQAVDRHSTPLPRTTWKLLSPPPVALLPVPVRSSSSRSRILAAPVTTNPSRVYAAPVTITDLKAVARKPPARRPPISKKHPPPRPKHHPPRPPPHPPHPPPPSPPPPPPPAPPAPPNLPWYRMFKAGAKLSPVVSAFNPSSLQTKGNHATIVFNGKGSRWQSRSKYSSGVFSANLRCPSSSAFNGLTFRFMLGDTSQLTPRQRIGFAINGDDPRSAIAIFSVGTTTYQKKLPLTFSCSDSTHLYSIYWDAKRVSWFVDKQLAHTYWPGPYMPQLLRPLFLFGSLHRPASAASGGSTGSKGNQGATALWQDITVITPLMAQIVAAPPLPPLPSSAFPSYAVTLPMAPIRVDYCPWNCIGCLSNAAGLGPNVIRFTNFCGSRFRSTLPFNFGLFMADVKCPSGRTSGLVTAFYLSSWEGSKNQDEVDFEFLGKNKTALQTNVYVGGIGNREMLHPLNFDCSKAFHNYAIVWTARRILWYIDRKLVRVMVNTTGEPYPSRPSYAYSSIWDASNKPQWAGRRDRRTLKPKWVTYASFKNMRVGSPWV